MKTTIGLIFFLLIGSVQAAGKTPVIELMKETRVPPGQLKLGQIAKFVNMKSIFSKKLSEIRLGNAPDYSETRRFTSRAISEILRKSLLRFRRGGIDAKLLIPNEVVIMGKGLQIDSSRVTEEIIKVAKTNCQKCKIKISDLTLQSDTSFHPASKWRLGHVNRLSGPFSIAINVLEPNGTKHNIWVTGRISFSRKVPVTTRLISPGQKLDKTDYKIEMRDVTYASDASVGKDELNGKEVLTTLTRGQIIWKQHLRKERALRAGQSVRILTGNVGWQIVVDGFAREGGYIGDLVKVLNPRTKKIVVGKIVEKGTVEVR